MSNTSNNVNGATNLLTEFGLKYNIANYGGNVNHEEVGQILCNTCFRQMVNYEQMSALMVVAKEYGLNPFTREIYAFPDKKGGIIPIVGVDGWCNMINNHPEYSGMEFNYSENLVSIKNQQKTLHAPEWIECILYRKDRDRPTVVREYFDEVYKDNSPVWKTHPKRMLRHKALIQCARYAFSFSGIYDHEEANQMLENEKIIEAECRDVSQHENKDAQGFIQEQRVQEQQAQEQQVQENDSREAMPENKFLGNLEKARTLVLEKVKPVDEILDFLQNKYRMTAEQIKAFKDLEMEVTA